MKNELEKLYEIIAISLSRTNLSRQKNRAAYLNKCSRSVISITGTLRSRIRLVVPGSENDKVKNCIGRVQGWISCLADIVFDYLPESAKRSAFSDEMRVGALEEILASLEGLIVFLEREFPDYFDRQQRIPEFRMQKLGTATREAGALLKRRLEESGISRELAEIISRAMELGGNAGRLRYRDLDYRGVLFSELFSTDVPDEQFVTRKLLYLDFNCPSFIDNYFSQIIGLAKEIPNIADRIEFYSLQIKKHNQLITKAGYTYDPASPGICSQLVSWISEELYHQERCLQLQLASKVQQNPSFPIPTKVQTSLSVSHLSLGLKLLIDAGVITNSNSSELIRMVARNFSTGKRENISEDSLRNKLYNVEQATIESIKELIIKMMNQVRQY